MCFECRQIRGTNDDIATAILAKIPEWHPCCGVVQLGGQSFLESQERFLYCVMTLFLLLSSPFPLRLIILEANYKDRFQRALYVPYEAEADCSVVVGLMAAL